MSFPITSRRWIEAKEKVRAYFKSVCAGIAHGSGQILYVILVLHFNMYFCQFSHSDMSWVRLPFIGRNVYEFKE